ncbi:MAG TPA: outer membrane beta-barrel protein [Pseudolabrys sp.]|nr:outer membrane beta-barrel protein [Pseudolabrys sp.]
MVLSIRSLSAAGALAVLCASAHAADYSIPISDAPLRGSKTYEVAPPTYPHWDGFYFGAQAGMSFQNADFSNASQSQITSIFQNTSQLNDVSGWTILGKGTASATAFGAFMGYNFQWDQLVAGVEANYNRLSGKQIGQTGTVGPIIASDGFTFTATSTATLKITDMLTLRGRAGYTIDRFMPYAFVGVGIARADISRTTNFTQVLNSGGANVTAALSGNPASESQSGALAYGVTAGLGVEAAITQNLFLRAEWEYVGFAPIHDIRANVNSARVGLGLKF